MLVATRSGVSTNGRPFRLVNLPVIGETLIEICGAGGYVASCDAGRLFFAVKNKTVTIDAIHSSDDVRRFGLSQIQAALQSGLKS